MHELNFKSILILFLYKYIYLVVDKNKLYEQLRKIIFDVE